VTTSLGHVLLNNGYDLFCANCRSLTNIVVHHIKAKRFGGTDDVDNLVPLCKECHLKVHLGETVDLEKKEYAPCYKPTEGRILSIEPMLD